MELSVCEEKTPLKDNLITFSRDVDEVFLWLDCDREGENIAFEVINIIGNKKYRRAKFSSLAPNEIRRAMHNFGIPDLNMSLSVQIRSELDFRVGCAFTRF